MVWSAGAEEELPSKVSNEAGLTAAAEAGGNAEEMEALQDEIEELREKVGDLEYEAQQIRNAAKHHVQEVR
jgi:polyhydroxyalkanoate synthesis regulator phasin